MIKTCDFFGNQVTRLALGDNPFCGHSYIHEIHSGGEMMDFYTAQTVLETLFEAEECGINTYVALADPFILRILRQYRNEGGKMNIIFQSYPPIDLKVNVHQMMACNPIGIYHQGGTFDLLVEESNFDLLHSRLDIIRESGVKVGFGTHVPDVILQAEKENWGVDFYLGCLYNARRTQRGQQSGFITGKPKELVFYPGDPPFMYEVVRNVSKPCIVFKLFAGGQAFIGKTQDEIPGVVESIFRETYDNIKPNDFAFMGIFQKYKNQLRENTDIAKRVLL